MIKKTQSPSSVPFLLRGFAGMFLHAQKSPHTALKRPRYFLAPFSGQNQERQRESLTSSNNTTNTNIFSLIYYIYRKIPESDSDRIYWLFTSVHYPFFYPFLASRLLFPQEYTVVIENKNFSEKSDIFSDVFLFVLRTELLLAMYPTWSEGVFFIYGHVLLSSAPDALPRIRAPPLVAPYSGQTPEASPALLPRLCVMPTFE